MTDEQRVKAVYSAAECMTEELEANGVASIIVTTHSKWHRKESEAWSEAANELPEPTPPTETQPDENEFDERVTALIQLMPWVYPNALHKDYRMLSENYAACNPEALLPIAVRAIEMQMELNRLPVAAPTERVETNPDYHELYMDAMREIERLNIIIESPTVMESRRISEIKAQLAAVAPSPAGESQEDSDA